MPAVSGHADAARPAINQPAAPGFRSRLSSLLPERPSTEAFIGDDPHGLLCGARRSLQVGARAPYLGAKRGELATRRTTQRDDRSHAAVIARLSPLYLIHLLHFHLMCYFMLAYLILSNI